MKHDEKALESRRGFLRSTLALGAAGAAGAALTSQMANAGMLEEPVRKPATKKKGYRVTSHVAAYYKTASF